MSMPMNTGRSSGQNMTGASGGYNPNFTVGKAQGGYKPIQMQNFPPEAMQLWKSLFPHVGPDSFLSKLAGGDEGMFNQIEAPAWKQFQQAQGQAASRFSGMGSGARHSSGFRNTMTQANQDFAGQLQSQRMGLQSQAIKDLMGMSNDLLNQRPYENMTVKKDMPFWKQLLLGVTESAGNAAAQWAGGSLQKPSQNKQNAAGMR